MNMRNLVLIVPTAILAALFIATLIVSRSHVRAFLFYSLLATAITLVIASVFVSWFDHEKLREQTTLAHDQLRREFHVEREMYRSTIQLLERDLKEMRRVLFGHVASCSAGIDDELASAIDRMLAEGVPAEDRDG